MAVPDAVRILSGIAVAGLLTAFVVNGPAQAIGDVDVRQGCRIDIERSGAVHLSSEVHHRMASAIDRVEALPALADVTRSLDSDLRTGELAGRFDDRVSVTPVITPDEIGYTARLGPIEPDELGELRREGVAHLPCGEVISSLTIISAGPFGVRADATAMGAGVALEEAQRAGLRVEREVRIAVPGKVISAPGAAQRSSRMGSLGAVEGMCTGLVPIQDARWAQPATGAQVHLVGSGWAAPWWVSPVLAGALLVIVAGFALALVRGLRRE